MELTCFANRIDAGRRLAARMRGSQLTAPLVLAIPRGGIEVAWPLATSMSAELDVVLSRKLRAPHQRELAIGAVSESGVVVLNPGVETGGTVSEQAIAAELAHQNEESGRRRKLYRRVRPRAAIAGRTVIVVDDGIATGATMLAALATIRAEKPRELIAAVPVAAHDRVEQVRAACDRIECLIVADEFWSVGQFYEDFGEVTDDRVLQILRAVATRGDGRDPAMH